MKTLKKTLCLVLAVVMVVGVLVLPANAAATTTEDTDATAAFKTLNEYGVMYGVDANNTPALDKNINRQDMAAIVYRIMTGDTSDTYKNNYVGTADKFADSATFADWAKGYIGYVRSKGIFVGDEKGNFKPEDFITGDEVLTVLLRCIGYGQNGEFTGAYWAENAETLATQIHLFSGTDRYPVKADMSKVISRGIVAKLTFNAVKAPMVTYYNGSYSDSNVDGRPAAPNTLNAVPNPSLISKTSTTAEEVTYDDWGVPSKATTTTVSFNYPNLKVTSTSKEDLKPMTTFWTAKSHCDVCSELKVETAISDTITVYTNGKGNKTTLAKLDPVNTQAQIGAQGRYTAIYDTNADKKPDVIVYKDTLLAKVTNVTEYTEDAAGHLKTPAKLELEIYDADGANTSKILEKTTKANWTYTKGQYLLVYAVQTAAGKVSTIKEAYVQGVAESVSGVQSRKWTNSDKHTVAGTDYNDNNRFHHDEAVNNMSDGFTWFKDSKGNLIGAVKNATAHAYGVINSMWWNDGTDGVGYAQAKVTYMDGTTDTLTVGKMTVNTAALAAVYAASTGTATQGDATNAMTITANSFYVNESAATNSTRDNRAAALPSDAGGDDIINGHLVQISTDSKGLSNFVEVGGTSANGATYANLYSLSTGVKKGVVSNGTMNINDSTQFLVRSGSSDANFKFTPYTGYKNIVDYQAAEVDYVDADADGYADYVYIIGAPVAESGWSIFFADASIVHDMDGDHAQMRYSETDKEYTVYGYLDGKAGSVTIKKSNVNGTDTTADNIVADFVNKANGNTLWLVKIEGGYVVDVNGANASFAAGYGIAVNGSYVQGTNTSVGYRPSSYTVAVQLKSSPNGMDAALTGTYADQSIIYIPAGTTMKLDSDTVLSAGSTKYTLDDNCLVFGSWAEINDAGTSAVLVFKTDTNTVTQAYVIAKDAGTEYDGGTTTTYTVTLATSAGQRIILPDTKTATTDGETAVTFTITGPMATATEALGATVTGGTADVKIELTNTGSTTGGYTYKVTVSDVTGNVTVTLNIVDPTMPISAAVPAGSSAALPAGSNATLPAGTYAGTVEANGSNVTFSDATTISGSLTGVNTLNGNVTVAEDATVEVEEIGAEAEITLESGASITAKKIAEGANVTVKTPAEESYGAAVNMQSTTEGAVAEAITVSRDGTEDIYLENIAGVVVNPIENATNVKDHFDGDGSYTANHYFFAWEGTAGHQFKIEIFKDGTADAVYTTDGPTDQPTRTQWWYQWSKGNTWLAGGGHFEIVVTDKTDSKVVARAGFTVEAE